MIDYVLIDKNTEGVAEMWEAEARLAKRMLLKQLPTTARVLHFLQPHDDLAQALQQPICANNLPGDALALYLPHAEILFAPGMLDNLLAASKHSDGPVCAYSNLSPPSDSPPDYLTLRGLERYTQSFAPGLAKTQWLGQVCLGRIRELAALSVGDEINCARNAYYHDFSGYRGHQREEMLALIPPNCPSLLDVGGGAGGFLAAVRRQSPQCRTALVELSPESCRLAASVADRIWQGDFAYLDIDERFACVSFLDVLEHSAQPQDMLQRARQLLNKGGCIIASIPNIGHWSVVADLIEGRWDYAPAGIHCITHLRFYTKASIEALFAEAGLVIERWIGSTFPPPGWFDLSRFVPYLTINQDSLSTVAWHLRARPA